MATFASICEDLVLESGGGGGAMEWDTGVELS